MSKRFTMFARLLAIILCLTMVLVGCSPATDNSNKDDGNGTVETKPKTPQEVLVDSLDKTMGALTNVGSPVNTLGKALNKGKITISAMDMVENVLYIDAENSFFANILTSDAVIPGEKLEVGVYLEDSVLALSAPVLLGDETYGLDFDTLLSDLEDSAIWGLLGMSYEDFQSQMNVDLEAVMDVITGAMDSVGELENALEDVAKDIKIESAEGKANIDGTEVDAIIITSTYTSDDLKTIMDAYMNWLESTANSMVADLSEAMGGMDLESEMGLTESLDSVKEELDAAFADMDLTFALTYNINPENGYLMSAAVKMSGTVDGEEGEACVDFVLGTNPVTSDKYTMSLAVDADGEETGKFDIVLNRDLGDSKDVYTLTATMTESEETTELLTGSLTYTKDSGDYELVLEADRSELKIDGKFLCSEKALELGVDSVEADGETTVVNVTVKIETIDAKDLPEMPEYTNILKLSQSELTDLITTISTLVGGDSSEPEYDYDYDYDYDFDDDYDYDYDEDFEDEFDDDYDEDYDFDF